MTIESKVKCKCGAVMRISNAIVDNDVFGALLECVACDYESEIYGDVDIDFPHSDEDDGPADEC